jgi:hypothetical protein
MLFMKIITVYSDNNNMEHIKDFFHVKAGTVRILTTNTLLSKPDLVHKIFPSTYKCRPVTHSA